MVPLICLLALVPLVACDGHESNQMQQNMMMQQMMQGWGNQGWGNQGWGNQGWGNQGWGNQGWGGQQMGGQQMGGQQGNQQWWGMQSQQDYEDYMKWCEARKNTMRDQEQQQELLKMWERQEEERKMEEERKKMERESNERHESMMAQWKMWQMRLSQQHEFDDLLYKFAEMKHAYVFGVTMEMLKFCKCSDFTEDIQRFFVHEGVEFGHNDDWDLDDLEGIDTTNPDAVAQALANRPATEQLKAFFGGLAMSLCEAGRGYVEQVRAWDRTYNFIDRLM